MAKYSKEFEHTRRSLIKSTIEVYDYLERMMIESADDIEGMLADPIDYSTEMLADLIRTPEVKGWMRAYSNWVEAVAERAMED